MKKLIEMKKNHIGPFDKNEINKYKKIYEELKKQCHIKKIMA